MYIEKEGDKMDRVAVYDLCRKIDKIDKNTAEIEVALNAKRREGEDIETESNRIQNIKQEHVDSGACRLNSDHTAPSQIDEIMQENNLDKPEVVIVKEKLNGPNGNLIISRIPMDEN
uniref:Uncharacterized protein n=1 Tax=Panagrolaimus superbus TaxID=310955 RepID=A0A914Y9A1_9BILA